MLISLPALTASFPEVMFPRRSCEFRQASKGGAMTQPGPSAEFGIQDISVDGDGRVTIANPRIAGRLLAAAAVTKTPKGKPAPNTNCAFCNTVEGCGPVNKGCNPNTVANCGCPSKIEPGKTR
jgi:hypothetical protein